MNMMGDGVFYLLLGFVSAVAATRHGHGHMHRAGYLAQPRFGFSKDTTTSFNGLQNLNAEPQQHESIHSRRQQTDGLTETDTFTYKGESWTVLEDLSSPSRIMTLVSAGGTKRTFTRFSESTNTLSDLTVEPWLGLDVATVNLAINDMLADALLKEGEPSEAAVRDVTPILYFPNWDAFLGNVQANDTMYVNYLSRTANYNPTNYYPVEFYQGAYQNWTYDALVGGWMPAISKVFRNGSDGDWFESMMFGDVDSQDPIIIHVWFRSTWVQDGKVKTRFFNYDYPEFLLARSSNPKADQFYGALLRFAEYWESHLSDMSELTLPAQDWADITKHAFAIELMQRYGGVYPKYGAVDRDYAGSEYDGFQDVFTMSVYANLLWGRFDQARAIIVNYFDWFVSPSGDINMRGPETGQFGLSLSLLAMYAQYTGDTATLQRYRDKILAWVNILTTRHDASLALNQTDPSYGLISGWSESDSSLQYDADFYFNKPYFSNTALAARGLKDLSKLSTFTTYAANWTARAKQMTDQMTKTLESAIKTDKGTAPYVPILPGEQKTVMESLTEDETSSQQWAHRVYSELLQAAVLPENLTDQTIDSMRTYGMTSLGIVRNVLPLRADTRDILGFISYGYALALLLRDRADEFALFLYSHRYHVHNRGLWVASEVAGTGQGVAGSNPYCQPAQHTLPVLVRAALVLEHPDEDVLYLGRGVPRAWVVTGKLTSIKGAPTRFGRVDYSVLLDQGAKTITAAVTFGGSVPREVRVKLRVPVGSVVSSITVNGRGYNGTLDGEELVLKGLDVKNITVIGSYGGNSTVTGILKLRRT